jgi:hypothetical protein
MRSGTFAALLIFWSFFNNSESGIRRDFNFVCQNDHGELTCELTVQELTSEEIDIIPANISSNVGKLQFTPHKRVNYLPSSIFKQCQKLKYLKASEIFLLEIRLENATNLVEFLCNRNKIEELADYTFLGAPNLEKIELHGNEISVIQEKAFYGLSKLKILLLGQNLIQRLGKNSFESLISLQKLFMHHGKLKFITKELFKNTVELEEIYMDYQEIDFIQPNFTENMKKLRILKLTGNKCFGEHISNHAVETTMKFVVKCYENYAQIRDDLSICDNETVRVFEHEGKISRKIENPSVDSILAEEQKIKSRMEEKIRNLYILVAVLLTILLPLSIFVGLILWKKFRSGNNSIAFTEINNSSTQNDRIQTS